MRRALMAFSVVLAGCTNVPLDPEGTLERVERTKVLRAGIIVPEGDAAGSAQRRFLLRVAADAGSRTMIARGSAETLLSRLERGDLDIVVGAFAADTPWADRVAIAPAPRQVPAGRPVPAVAVRSGENGWLTRLYEHVHVMQGVER